MSKILTKTVTAGRPSLNYMAMQYLMNTKKKMPFDPVVALNHFVAPGGVAEPSTIQGLDVEKRMRSRIGYLVESLTDAEESLAGKKRFTNYICQANDLRFAGTKKTKTLLFPFSGATFFLSRDGQGVRKAQTGDAREKLRSQLKLQLKKLMDKEKATPLLDKFIETGEIAELTKGIEILIEIMLKKRIIPYGYNSYLNEVKRMQSLVSARTDSLVAMESVKIRSIYQSAALMAQDICFQLRQSRTSFRAIFSSIVRDLPSAMPCGITGIRVSCSGRLGGAEIARIECGKYGRTSLNVFHQKTDYAFSEVSTRYGILGVKVWILGKYRPSVSAGNSSTTTTTPK